MLECSFPVQRLGSWWQGTGRGRAGSLGKLTLRADRQMGWRGKEGTTPLSLGEHNAHAWAPDLAIVPAPPPPVARA